VTVHRRDVAVVGVGTVGSMTLWQLAKRGASVVGFEQWTPGHSRGAAAGETRWFRTASEHAADLPLMRRSVELWRELEQDAGVPLLDLTGGLYVGQPDSPFVTGVLHNVDRFGIRHDVLDESALIARFPQLVIEPGEIGVLDHESGQALAAPSVAMAAKAARRHGADLVDRTRVDAIRLDGERVIIVAGDDEWHVDRVVLATGPWGNELLPDLVPHLDVQRIAVHWYPLEDPEAYLPDRFPIFERTGSPLLFGVWPTADRATLKVTVAAPLDHILEPGDLHQRMSDAVLRTVDEYVERYLRGVVPNAVRQTVAMDGYTADQHFLLGSPAADPRVILAVGLSGHGFKMSPATGAIAADLALTGRTDEDITAFDPARFVVEPFLR